MMQKEDVLHACVVAVITSVLIGLLGSLVITEGRISAFFARHFAGLFQFQVEWYFATLFVGLVAAVFIAILSMSAEATTQDRTHALLFELLAVVSMILVIFCGVCLTALVHVRRQISGWSAEALTSSYWSATIAWTLVIGIVALLMCFVLASRERKRGIA